MFRGAELLWCSQGFHDQMAPAVNGRAPSKCSVQSDVQSVCHSHLQSADSSAAVGMAVCKQGDLMR